MNIIKLYKKRGLSYILKAIISELNKKLFVFKINFYYKNKNKESFSQYSEDLFIDILTGYKKEGVYIDIGANHPEKINNTKKFYDRGWSGVNVEPNYNKLKLFKSNRPRDINLNVGIGASKSPLLFYNFNPDTLSTFSKEVADELIMEGMQIAEKKEVPVITLEDVFKKLKYNRVDFISIDTEGYDKQVLKSNNWNLYRPKVICIEDGTGHEHDGYLKSVGYKKKAFNGLNSFFIDSY